MKMKMKSKYQVPKLDVCTLESELCSSSVMVENVFVEDIEGNVWEN